MLSSIAWGGAGAVVVGDPHEGQNLCASLTLPPQFTQYMPQPGVPPSGI